MTPDTDRPPIPDVFLDAFDDEIEEVDFEELLARLERAVKGTADA